MDLMILKEKGEKYKFHLSSNYYTKKFITSEFSMFQNKTISNIVLVLARYFVTFNDTFAYKNGFEKIILKNYVNALKKDG